MEKANAVEKLNTIVIDYGVLAFLVLVLVLVIAVIYMYMKDITQHEHTIRRNFPVIGRFRYLFEKMGEFFRQYFFAMDREEMPFNRAQRSWVYRAAKDVDSTLPFGSTRQMNRPGEVIFLNCFFPTLSYDAAPARDITIGEGFAREPYTTSSIYNISGMSFGAISVPAIRALSGGAKKAGVWMNTGEGGLTPYHLEGGCDIVFQIGTAKYGVRDANGELSDEKLKKVAEHPEVKMFEIKISQGAKPGKGGILPAAKITEEIAAIRGIPMGEDSMSPNGHPDIRSVDDLLDMIVRIRNVTGRPVGFKTVVGETRWLDELCKSIHRRGLQDAPDFITIDSADGGTGASPQSLMDYMGMPLNRSLPMIVDALIENGLRNRIKIIASGKLVNPADVAWAIAVGADFVVSARGYMFALGCVQAMQCNKNTCPTGVTTHDKKLQRGLVVEDKLERVYHFATNMAYEVSVIAHSCGVKEPRALNRSHAEIINDQGVPIPMEEVYPPVQVKEEFIKFVEETGIREAKSTGTNGG